ncbi:MAG: pyrroline-5-carboxylate reductase [Thermoanaerobaculia bacterium]
MHIDSTIGFVGAGNMAEALIRGLLKGGHVDASKISASGPRTERMEELSERFGIQTTTDNREVVARSGILVLSVKPQIMRRVLTEIAETLRDDVLVISIAAGVPISTIEARLRREVRIIRAMPNTPALVDAGATAIAKGAHATADDVALATRIFDAVGITVVLEEIHLDAVTGLSGSGPAYMFLILEALSDAGVKVGLSRRNAQLLAAQTVLGSAKLLLETNYHPGLLKDMVTSPGGTAIAGLHTLEAGGLRTTLMNAVEVATNRSKELGKAMLQSEQ